MKNIIICADGTGNTTIKGRGTNVFKLYEAVDQAGHRLVKGLRPQVARYHDGVGTESLKWLRLLTGATGWGLTRNVKQLYGELARVYAPGDKIFLFGFSRGAFTVRTLAGLIHACGILDLSRSRTNATLSDGVDKAYREYRRQYNSLLTAIFYETKELTVERIKELRARFSVPIPEFEDEATHGKLIAFMGVWDTVAAVGLPIHAADFVNRVIYAFKFPDRTLNLSVAHACHALALDEERESFDPVIWNERETAKPERIEQVWFAGVHSNVGGGYPRQGMSLAALDWMMAKAEERGLRFVEMERSTYKYHSDVDDKMYDSRAGLGIFYRWLPRNVQRLCARDGVTPKVHRSIFERIARNTEGYAPGCLPGNPLVISLSQPSEVTDAIQDLVQTRHGCDGPLVERAASLQKVGIWAYWLSVYGVAISLILIVSELVRSALADAKTWAEIGQNIAGNLISSKWIGVTLETLWRYPWLVAWLILTFPIALWVDNQLDKRYSEFWHDVRLDLRKVLGLG